MKLKPLFYLFFSFFLGLSSVAASPIYVIELPDGSTKFTTKPPPSGVKAKIFTAKKSNFSYYKVSPLPYTRRTKIFSAKYHQLITRAAADSGVDPALVKAVIHVESAFNPAARSEKGAVGLMQLMPETAVDNGVRNRYSPLDNILGGVKHLKRLLEKYKGDLKLVLAAYNAGEGAVETYGGIPPFEETRNYVRRVLYFHRIYGSHGT